MPRHASPPSQCCSCDRSWNLGTIILPQIPGIQETKIPWSSEAADELKKPWVQLKSAWLIGSFDRGWWTIPQKKDWETYQPTSLMRDRGYFEWLTWKNSLLETDSVLHRFNMCLYIHIYIYYWIRRRTWVASPDESWFPCHSFLL